MHLAANVHSYRFQHTHIHINKLQKKKSVIFGSWLAPENVIIDIYKQSSILYYKHLTTIWIRIVNLQLNKNRIQILETYFVVVIQWNVIFLDTKKQIWKLLFMAYFQRFLSLIPVCFGALVLKIRIFIFVQDFKFFFLNPENA